MNTKELVNALPCPFCGSIPFGRKNTLKGIFELECYSVTCIVNPKIFADAPITNGIDKGTITLDFIEAEESAKNRWNDSINSQHKWVRKECYEIFKSRFPNLDSFGYIKKQMLNE